MIDAVPCSLTKQYTQRADHGNIGKQLRQALTVIEALAARVTLAKDFHSDVVNRSIITSAVTTKTFSLAICRYTNMQTSKQRFQ